MGPRIVSLVPSATEILWAIGGRGLLVGRSHECDFPPGLDDVPVLTGQTTSASDPAEIDRQVREQLSTGVSLYTLNTQALKALRPDVILTQDLCSVCSIDLATVRGMVQTWEHVPRIVSLNPQSLEDVLDNVLEVGEAAGLPVAATRTVVELRERLYSAAEFVNPYDDGPSVVFLEWTDPLFIGGHWIPQLIERAGARHPLNPTVPIPGSGAAAGPQQAARRAGKSVRIADEVLQAADPDVLIICPCGVGLNPAIDMATQLLARPGMARLRAARSGRVAVIDGNQMFSRPGPRLLDAFEWLTSWLQDRPELAPARFPWKPLDPN